MLKTLLDSFFVNLFQMKNYKTIYFAFIFLISFVGHSQIKKHTISSQGVSTVNEDVIMTYSLAQSSVTSSSNFETPMILGFQSPNWPDLIDGNNSFTFDMYPNPFENNVVIFTEIPLEIQSKISVYDINGRLVFSSFGIFNDGRMILNLSNLSSGAYLIRVQNDKKTFFKKLIKR